MSFEKFDELMFKENPEKSFQMEILKFVEFSQKNQRFQIKIQAED